RGAACPNSIHATRAGRWPGGVWGAQGGRLRPGRMAPARQCDPRGSNLAESSVMRKVDTNPTSVSVLSSLSLLAVLAAMSIAAALVMAPGIAVAAGAGAPSGGGGTGAQSPPAPQKKAHAQKHRSSSL